MNPFQYVGQKGYYRDGVTEDYFARRRPLPPAGGRWRSKDPIAILVRATFYTYVGNAPMTLADPSGEFPVLIPFDPTQPFPWPPWQAPPQDEKNPSCLGKHKWQRFGWNYCKYRSYTPNPSFTPVTNHCTGVPSTFEGGKVDFRPACDAHDLCYQTCARQKVWCDILFYGVLTQICNTVNPLSRRVGCQFIANTYFYGVLALGKPPYESSQDEACLWKTCCCPFPWFPDVPFIPIVA